MSCCYEKDKSYKTDKMKKEVIQELYNGFEAVAVEVEGIECWSARKLQLLLGYSKWENFSKVIDKAKIACENAGSLVSDHFPDVRKMVNLGLGSEREIDDILLTRYGCYLIAQNADPLMERYLSFCEYLYSYVKESQVKCGLESKKKNEYLSAMRDSVSDSTHIKALVQPAVTTKIHDREMFMKGIDYSYYYEQE